MARNVIDALQLVTALIHSRRELPMGLAKVRSGFLVFALAATFVLQSTLIADPAYACFCAELPTPLEELKSSDAVFVGKAVENGLRDPNPRDNAKFGGIRFDVSKSWKGVTGKSVVIYGQSRSYYGPPEEGEMMVESSCAVPFTRGKTYLVYASRDAGFLKANACGGTGSLTSVGKDLEALGPPTDLLPNTGGPAVHLLDATLVGASAFLLLALASAFAAAGPRRSGGRRRQRADEEGV